MIIMDELNKSNIEILGAYVEYGNNLIYNVYILKIINTLLKLYNSFYFILIIHDK